MRLNESQKTRHLSLVYFFFCVYLHCLCASASPSNFIALLLSISLTSLRRFFFFFLVLNFASSLGNVFFKKAELRIFSDTSFKEKSVKQNMDGN